MVKLLSNILIILSISIPSFGGCPNPVTILKQGDAAPCYGYLFSPEKESELYLMKKEYDILKQEIEVKDKYISLMQKDATLYEEIIKKEQEKTNLWKTTAEENTLKLVKMDENRGNRDLLFLGSGILLTVLAGWAVGQAGK